MSVEMHHLNMPDANGNIVNYEIVDQTARTKVLPTVSASDNSKVLTVVSGAWAAATPATELPAVTASDSGKLLQVNSSGVWVAVSLDGNGVSY